MYFNVKTTSNSFRRKIEIVVDGVGVGGPGQPWEARAALGSAGSLGQPWQPANNCGGKNSECFSRAIFTLVSRPRKTEPTVIRCRYADETSSETGSEIGSQSCPNCGPKAFGHKWELDI